MLISYCSQVKNRLHQFKQTFKTNFEHIKSNKNTEWIIVDCDSSDDLYNYIKNIGHMDRVHYYRTLDYNTYSIPVAKNFSIRLSSGDYVFNLDIDNYIGEATNQIMSVGCDTGICCKVFKKGVYGRIGCSREVFNLVGGNDEYFLPAGKHDTDFMARCNLINYKFQHMLCDVKPILNSKADTIVNMNSNLDWKEMNVLNGEKMKYNIQNNIFCPNQKFTSCELEYNFEKIITLSEEMACC